MLKNEKTHYWCWRVDATFEGEDVYNQKDAAGFIRLNALRLKIANLMKRK